MVMCCDSRLLGVQMIERLLLLAQRYIIVVEVGHSRPLSHPLTPHTPFLSHFLPLLPVMLFISIFFTTLAHTHTHTHTHMHIHIPLPHIPTHINSLSQPYCLFSHLHRRTTTFHATSLPMVHVFSATPSPSPSPQTNPRQTSSLM